MTTHLTPDSAEAVRDIVADALAREAGLNIIGNGSKRSLGHPFEAATTVSLSGLSGVVLHEPEELVLRARPGTPMDQLFRQLEQHGQMLAFEPPDYGPLLGELPDRGTIGGVIAGNLSGPRRIKSGAARDHFLGFDAVSGRAEIFRSGGRVVKNVTGYDLSKLMCGSWGTLGILTDIILKVLPAPERTRTVLVDCAEAGAATRAMTLALSSPFDVSGAAWIPREFTARSAVSHVAGAQRGLIALRVEGMANSVLARCEAIRQIVSPFGDLEELHTTNSKTFWRELADARYLAEDPESVVWRISVPPSEAAAIHDTLHRELPARGWLDWGGGLIWLAVAAGADAGAASIRREAERCGGHATLVRADTSLRQDIDVFQPEPPPLARLTRNIRDAFDPKRILNPGHAFGRL